jgi:hypothetical protein
MINQAYSEEASGLSAVFKWHKRFAQGRDSLDDDDEHTGRPRTVCNWNDNWPSSPRKMKPQCDRSKGTVMLELFFDSSGIVRVEFIA